MNDSCLFRLALSLLALSLCPGAARAGTLSVIEKSRWVEIEHVFDGDTVRTKKGEKIRLLGINTPEIAHDKQPGQTLGNEAGQRLRELVLGKTVRLRLDKERRDKYGRTLAHIYLRDHRWINEVLVREGFAHVYTFAPNFRGARKLLLAEAEARQARRGIWRTARFQVLDSELATSLHIGQFRTVEGTVSKSGPWQFRLSKLNISIPRAYRRWFKTAPALENGLRIRVRGMIRASPGDRLFLAVHSPFDMEIIR